MTPRTSVLVLNHNGGRWLGSCLASLPVGRADIEVIVVDNASTDASRQIVGGRRDVRLLELPVNVGFAAGNNAGARAARASDYLVFLNNDTEVQPGGVDALVEALDTRCDAGLVTAHIVRLDDPSVVDSAGDGYLRAGGAYKRWHGQRRAPGPAIQEVFGACGAAFAVRRTVFEALAGFDERLFMVYEDVDLSYRAQLAGWRCLYVPRAVVRHAGSASLGVESAAAVFYGQRNLEWVWVKNTPLSLLVRDFPAHLAYSATGLAYYVRRGRAVPALRGKLAALWGLPAILASRTGRGPGAATLPARLRRHWWSVKRQERAHRHARIRQVDGSR